MTSKVSHSSAMIRGAIAIVIMCFSIVMAVVVVRATQQESREELQEHAGIIAASLDVDHVNALTGTASDLASSEYQSIKESLHLIRSASPDVRFVYLVAEQDGEVVVLVDSESPESLDYSPPGDVYVEAPPALVGNILSREAFYEGSYTDRWGTWVSAFAPMLQETSRPVLVGVDIDADVWTTDLLLRVALSLGASMLMLLALFAYHLFQLQRERFVRRLLREEERTRAILDQLPVGAMMFSIPEGRPVMWNKKAVELLGREIDSSITASQYASTFKLFTAKGAPYPNDELPVGVVLRTKKTCFKDDMVIHQPHGREIPIHATAAPLIEGGVMTFVMAVFEDITKQRDTDRAKSEFVSIASHQLRTPLTGIKWFCELLLAERAGALQEKQREYLKDVQESNSRMIALVEDLLNVSRIELGRKFDVIPQSTELGDLVKSIIHAFAPHAESRKQRIDLEAAEKELMCDVDPEKLRQALGNILSNALKFSPEGSTVTVTIARKKGGVSIAVADRGIGIPEGEHRRVFEKFFRAENAATHATEGTGLGLYIARAIVLAHGGTLTFTSKKGKGTTFTMTFPCSKSVK